MQRERGGKTVYGAGVGILMLETQFPRVLGDIGNAGTWPFPVQYRIVRGASPDKVVRKRAEGLVPDFIAAARDLAAHGCEALTTNCGFLALVQAQLTAEVEIPVMTSSLSQVPLANAMLPAGKRAGIITISREDLSEDHLRAVGVPLDTAIVGTEGGREFTRAILDDEPEIDFAACREDLRDAAKEIMAEHPDTGAIILECTNMMPYAADIRKLTGLPVYSIYTLVCWVHSGVFPRRFPHLLDDSVPS